MTVTTCIVKFGLYALALKSAALFDASGIEEQAFSSVEDLKRGNTVNKPYITLEPNYWLLDGNYKFMPTSNPRTGIMSTTMSDVTGSFTVPPELLIEFAEDQSANGLTLKFGLYSNDYADDLTITFYNSVGGIIRTDTYYPVDADFSTGQAVTNFRSILIQFNDTNKPHRYLRLTGVDFGSLIEFTSADIVYANVLERINPISTELAPDTFELSLYSTEAAFSIVNPSGEYQYLQERQPLDVLLIVDDVTNFIGTFYLDKWINHSETTIDFTCFDAIGVMVSIPDYFGGMYFEESALTVIQALMDSAGISFELDSYYDDTTITGWIPILSHRDALQHIAFALGAYVTCARSGIIQIKRSVLAVNITETDYSIPRSAQGVNQSLTLKTLVTGVQLYAHDYSEGSEIKQIFSGYLVIGQQTVTFSEPIHSLIVTGANILSYSANHTVLDITVPGQVTITGKTYVDTSEKYAIYTSDLDPSVKKNTVVIQNATLVNSLNVATLTEHVYTYFQQRYHQKVPLLVPSAFVGSFVLFNAIFSQTITGIVEKMNMELAGGFTVDTDIIGVVNP